MGNSAALLDSERALRFLTTAPYIDSGEGGLSANDSETAGKLVDAAKRVSEREMSKYIEIRGLDRVNHGLQLKEKYRKYLLSLDKDPEVVWNRLEQRAKTAVRKAMKCGLAVEWGSHLLSDFVNVESRITRDLGAPCQREPFYRNILEEFPGRAEHCLVRYREEFIGGALSVTFKKTLVGYAGGCLKAYRDMAIMNLL